MENMKETLHSPEKLRKGKKKLLEHWQKVAVFLIIYDLLVANGAYFMALWLRFDCRYTEIPEHFVMSWVRFAPIYAVITVLVLWRAHLYQSVWSFASFVEMERIAVASLILGVIHALGITLLFDRMPITYYVGGIVLQFCATVFVRLQKSRPTFSHSSRLL